MASGGLASQPYTPGVVLVSFPSQPRLEAGTEGGLPWSASSGGGVTLVRSRCERVETGY
jgi:hypothetical protein